MKAIDFIGTERRAQADYFRRCFESDMILPQAGYRLNRDCWTSNLSPAIRDQAIGYFSSPRNITWHRSADHGLSSQIMCLNFLMPLASEPEVLADVIGRALSRNSIRMLPVEGGPQFVGFEWIGEKNYLGEWGQRSAGTRGANVTSADAVVRFQAGSSIETVLIEWKYTENYGTPPDPEREPERRRRYSDKAFHPNGPLRADLGLEIRDLFWEPIYQMFRQQILAFEMQKARENGAGRVSVLHISPAGNIALHKVTAPRLKAMGTDVFKVFRDLLVDSTDFTFTTVERAFGPTLHAHSSEPWAAYLLDRYGRLLSHESTHAQETA